MQLIQPQEELTEQSRWTGIISFLVYHEPSVIVGDIAEDIVK